MSFFMTLAVAVRALRRNTMRTALTALGMIIGVAAVIVMVAIGAGADGTLDARDSEDWLRAQWSKKLGDEQAGT